MEEWVSFDFLGAVDSEPFSGVAVQKSRENAAGLGTNLWAKYERVVKDFLIHLVSHLYCMISYKLQTHLR